MVNVIQGGQGLDDFHMGFVFFQLRGADGQADGVHAEPGACVGLVGLNIVDAQPQPAADCDEIPQIRAAFQLHVNLKMVGAVFQIGFKGGKPGQNGQQEQIHNQGQGVQPRTGGESKNAAAHKSGRGGQSLDLPPGGVENGIGTDGGNGQQGGGGQHRHFAAQKQIQILIQQRGHGGGEGHKHEGSQTGAVPLAGSLAADGGRQTYNQREPQQQGSEIDFLAPSAQQMGNGIAHGHPLLHFLFPLVITGLTLPDAVKNDSIWAECSAAASVKASSSS